MKFFLGIWLLALLIWVELVAIGAEQTPRTSLRLRLVEDAGTFDWNNGEVNQEIIAFLQEGLYRTDRNGNPELAVAQSVKKNKNLTKFIFQLDPKYHWKNGQGICAADFVRSWQRLQDKSFASPYGHYAAVLRSYTATSCSELVVETKRSAPELPALLAHHVFFPIHENLDASGSFTMGPYFLEKWVRDQSVVLAPNPHHPSYSPGQPRLEFLFIPEDTTALALYDKKQLDIVFHVPHLLRPLYAGQLLTMPQLTNYFFAFGAGTDAVTDPELRQALRAALNPGDIRAWLGQEIQPLDGRLLPRALQEKKVRFTPGKWNKASIVKKLEKQKNLKLRIYNKAAHKQLAEWAQARWLKAFGIKIPIEVQEEKVYWQGLQQNSAPLFLNGITAPFAHPRAVLQDFLPDSSANWTGFRSQKFAALVTKGLYSEAERLLWDSAYVIPLYERGQVVLASPLWRQKIWINPLGRLLLLGASASGTAAPAL